MMITNSVQKGSAAIGVWLFALACSASAPDAGPGRATSNGETREMGSSSENWTLEVETEGGITGKGVGNTTLRSDGTIEMVDGARRCAATASEAELRAIGVKIGKLPKGWDRSYVPASNPRGNADQIRYVLQLKKGSAVDGQRAEWIDQSSGDLPEALARIYDSLSEIRAKAQKSCA